jgi:hypothetical protein
MEALAKTSIVQTILTPGLTQLPPGLQNAHAGAKREQNAERKLDKSQPLEWIGSVGIPEFRWRDRTGGKAVYRRIVLGSAQQFPTEIEARAAAAGIVLEINVNDPRVQTRALTTSQLAEHYRHRELSPDNTWKSQGIMGEITIRQPQVQN